MTEENGRLRREANRATERLGVEAKHDRSFSGLYLSPPLPVPWNQDDLSEALMPASLKGRVSQPGRLHPKKWEADGVDRHVAEVQQKIGLM